MSFSAAPRCVVFLGCLLLGLPWSLQAQFGGGMDAADRPSPAPGEHAVQQDSSVRRVPRFRKVMIVPIDMTYYLSDADHDFAVAMQQDLPSIQQTLRYGLDGTVAASVEQQFPAHRILLDTIPEANPDLNRLRAAVRYTYARPWGAKPVEQDRTSTEKPGKRLRNLFEGGFDQRDAMTEDGGDADFEDLEFEDGQLRGPVEGRRFMHAVLRDTSALTDIRATYGTDLFVFVNQLEVRTNYAHCLDRATGTFARELSIHYSIYDHTGKLYAGDVVTVLVGSNTNDVYDVMASAFPTLADAVVRGLPNQRYVRSDSPGVRQREGQGAAGEDLSP